MVGLLLDGDEVLQSVDGAEDAVDAFVAFGRDAGVLGMAGHADFVLVGDGDDAVEEIGDALPEGVGVDVAGPGEGWVGVRCRRASSSGTSRRRGRGCGRCGGRPGCSCCI